MQDLVSIGSIMSLRVEELLSRKVRNGSVAAAAERRRPAKSGGGMMRTSTTATAYAIGMIAGSVPCTLAIVSEVDANHGPLAARSSQ
jgi:hypothetical protein